MIELLQSILNAISTLFELIISSIKSLVTIITHIPNYITWISNVVAYLPVVFIPFITVSISLWLLYFVLGRDH